MTDDRVWHYLKPNHTVRVPRRHIFLDTEARTDRTGGQHVQTWRCAVATYRHAPKKRRPRESTVDYRDLPQLWADVTEFARAGSRTVLWAHNLSYDLRISEAFTRLAAQGWRVVAHNLASHGTWITWRRDTATLVMVDSASVFPTGLGQIAKSFMTTKTSLPSEQDSEDRWLARCRRDVEILRNAIVAYLDWIETEGLGNWQLTGAGQSWAAFRHRFLTHHMLVHDDADALAAERRAMWTGRCEAYWHGTVHHTRIDEWDLTSAYARIARSCDVPTRLVGPLPPKWTLERWLDEPGYAILAEVEVTVSVPVVPTLHDGRILWPTGTFVTTLWDPELRACLRAGARVSLRRAWLYRAESALSAWGDWILGKLESKDGSVPAWQLTVLKHWSRALIGRFGMTYSDWEEFGTLPYADCRQWTYHDRDTGQTSEMIQLGRTVWRDAGQAEWDQSMPMVTGWIMSRCRALLWYLLEHAPPRAVLYADTDSLLATAEHHAALTALAATAPDVGLRVKRSWTSVTILGPRQLVTGDRVRVAGIPVRAERMADGSLRGEVWESLGKSIKERRPHQVRVTPRRWKVRGKDRRRDPGPDGWTRARALAPSV